MPTVAALQGLDANAVLKFQVGALLIADDDAPLLTSPFDVSGVLQAFPVGYKSAGLTNTDGISLGRAITVAEVNAWQTVQPVRADVTDDKLSIKVKFQETNPVTLAIQEGIRMADIDTSGSVFTNVRDGQGFQPKRRVIMIAEDQLRSVIVIRHLPNCILTQMGSDQQYQRGNELIYDYQLDAYPDPALLDADGNPSDSQFWIGGSGWTGIENATTPPPAWLASHAYTVGQRVTLTGGAILTCTVSGTSGSTAPTPPAVNSTVVDGTVTWKRLS